MRVCVDKAGNNDFADGVDRLLGSELFGDNTAFADKLYVAVTYADHAVL